MNVFGSLGCEVNGRSYQRKVPSARIVPKRSRPLARLRQDKKNVTGVYKDRMMWTIQELFNNLTSLSISSAEFHSSFRVSVGR